jgi:hypothetical protein
VDEIIADLPDIGVHQRQVPIERIFIAPSELKQILPGISQASLQPDPPPPSRFVPRMHVAIAFQRAPEFLTGLSLDLSELDLSLLQNKQGFLGMLVIDRLNLRGAFIGSGVFIGLRWTRSTDARTQENGHCGREPPRVLFG